MATEEPAGGRTPGEGGDTPSVPDAVWRKFLDDTEHAIRTSAPRELSARERAREVRHVTADTEGPGQERRRETDERGSGPMDAVGEMWELEDRWPPAWRDMDSRARRRRAGRALGTVAAVIVAVGALSHLPTGSGAPDGTPGDSTSQQSEDVLPDGVPTATDLPSAPAYAGSPPPTPHTG
ncbi:hypothetical protein [Streptomyces sp. NBC_00996]|uniref:hypothetical protein n=1 Tax=Streptomyces sp. NBC_00996 TaxID=2903710 RepID=UPI00386ECEE3|nr:hypothetical protein OG390_01685 [Streptomyces sp. NBC_00996]